MTQHLGLLVLTLTMPEIDTCTIKGYVCGIHELGKGAARSSSCRDCGFSDWAPNDRKFIIEHDHDREHLCPHCAVERGLDENHFHENANDARKCPQKPEFDEKKCSMRHCRSVAGTTKHTVGAFSTQCLIEAIDNVSGEKIMVCPTCWVENAVDQVRETHNYDYESKPDEVIDQFWSVCSKVQVKHPQPQEGQSAAGAKRHLPDSAEEQGVTKVAK